MFQRPLLRLKNEFHPIVAWAFGQQFSCLQWESPESDSSETKTAFLNLDNSSKYTSVSIMTSNPSI